MIQPTASIFIAPITEEYIEILEKERKYSKKNINKKEWFKTFFHLIKILEDCKLMYENFVKKYERVNTKNDNIICKLRDFSAMIHAFSFILLYSINREIEILENNLKKYKKELAKNKLTSMLNSKLKYKNYLSKEILSKFKRDIVYIWCRDFRQIIKVDINTDDPSIDDILEIINATLNYITEKYKKHIEILITRLSDHDNININTLKTLKKIVIQVGKNKEKLIVDKAPLYSFYVLFISKITLEYVKILEKTLKEIPISL